MVVAGVAPGDDDGRVEAAVGGTLVGGDEQREKDAGILTLGLHPCMTSHGMHKNGERE